MMTGPGRCWLLMAGRCSAKIGSRMRNRREGNREGKQGAPGPLVLCTDCLSALRAPPCCRARGDAEKSVRLICSRRKSVTDGVGSGQVRSE